MGLLWKANIEKMYEELGKKEVAFFSPEEESKFEKSFDELKLVERAARSRREFRRQLHGLSANPKHMFEGGTAPQASESDGGESRYDSLHSDN